MFYLREIAALLLCWLFYCEFYWMVERRVLKACSRQLIDRRCKTIPDRLFFTPVSTKAKLGAVYYINKYAVLALVALTLFHLALGWIEYLELFIRILTTVFVVVSGTAAAVNSPSATETVCANFNISPKGVVWLMKAVSVISELFLMLAYLYFAWCYIG